MAEPRQAPFGHESPGVATRKVVGVVLALGTVAAIALVALWLALTYLVMPRHAQLKTQPAVLPPAPRLQPHPDNDLTALREEKRALLDGYAWADKSHQFARIPIGRAMQMYVQEEKQGAGSREQGAVGKGHGPRRDVFAPKSERGTMERSPDGNSSGLRTRDSGLGAKKPGPGARSRKRAAGTSAVSASSGRQL